MRMTTWLRLCFLGLAVVVGSPVATREAIASGTLPASVAESLAQLKRSFRGMIGGESPGLMADEVTRNQATIDSILAFGRSSDASRDGLAAHLLGDLDGFSKRFKPGVQIDDAALARRFWVGEAPEYGISTDALLLLELADSRKSAAFTRKSLSAVYDAALSNTYLNERRQLKWTGDADEIAREKREFGGVGSTTGAELAWCCERFMLRAYASGALAGLPEAQSVLRDCRLWRKATMRELGASRCLPIPYLPCDYQHRTMEWVKKLVDALGTGDSHLFPVDGKTRLKLLDNADQPAW